MSLKRTLFLSVFFLGFYGISIGQTLLDVGLHSDCSNSLNIGTDTIIGPTTAPLGFGNSLEIKNQPSKSLYSFTREHHTVWYEFEAVHTGTLTFDLAPEVSTNDYDFLLFKGTAAELCDAIKNGTVKPVRTNISRFNPQVQSKTGLSLEAKAEFVHSGPGDDYSKALPIKKGERYLLVVDNVYKNGKGHTIKFHYTDIVIESSGKKQVAEAEVKKENPPKKEVIIINEPPTVEKEKQKQKVIHLYDKPQVEENTTAKARKQIPVQGNITGKNNSGLKAVITCRDRNTGRLLASTSTDDGNYQIEIPVIKGVKEYRLEIFSDGHFFTDTLFSIRNLTKISQEGISRKLQPLEVGATFRVNNINFYGDSPKPLPESIYVYQNIEQIMKAYKNMKIKVEGHTNGCHGGIESSTLLSIARAESVKKYLGRNGVSENRIEIKGWGCAKMLYPYPEDESQARLNRRVEIKILEL